MNGRQEIVSYKSNLTNDLSSARSVSLSLSVISLYELQRTNEEKDACQREHSREENTRTTSARTDAHDETIETRQEKHKKNPVFGFVKIQTKYTEG